MVTDFQHTVSLPQRLLHFIILSICRCYLIRDFFDVAVRIQQIDQFTVDLRHITVDLIDIELCRIGNIFICQLAVFPNAPEQADNKPHQDQKNRSSKPQGRILQTAYSNAMQHPSFSFLPEIHKRIHPSFFSVCRATAGRRTLPRSSGSPFTLTECICSYVLCNTAHYTIFSGFVHAESVFHMVKTEFSYSEKIFSRCSISAPSFTNTGMVSIGAATVTFCPPSYFSPVHALNHAVPAGR